MQLVEVIAKAHFENSVVGAISRKQRIRIPVNLANHLAKLDLVDLVDPPPAVVEESPKTVATDLGGDEPQSLSQPVRVLPKKTANTYRKNKKAQDGESLQ